MSSGNEFVLDPDTLVIGDPTVAFLGADHPNLAAEAHTHPDQNFDDTTSERKDIENDEAGHHDFEALSYGWWGPVFWSQDGDFLEVNGGIYTPICYGCLTK